LSRFDDGNNLIDYGDFDSIRIIDSLL